MKLSFLAGAAVGYVLGAKAGRQRYETIVATARKISGSQTVQSTAGVVQAQLVDLTARVRELVGQQLSSAPPRPPSANGHTPH